MNFNASVFPFTRRALLAALAASALGAQAQVYRGAIKLLVGYPPGGPADIAARIVAEKLSGLLGQPVVVDNRPGAGGQLAAQALKAAPADGSTLFLSNTHTVVTIPLTVKSPGFAPATDFRTVGAVASFELAIAVNAKVEARNIAELGQWFAKHREQASLGVPAAGSAPEFLGLRVTNTFKADTVPVAYKGATPLVQDLLGGQVTAGVSGIAEFLPHHQTGKLRILAVTRATPLVPGVPSFAEAGMPGLELTDFLGIYAPAATPQPVVERYNAALNRVLAMPEVVEKLQTHVMSAMPGTPADHADRLGRATRVLSDLVASAGVKP